MNPDSITEIIAANFPDTGSLLVAVSGGVDSMVLLHAVIHASGRSYAEIGVAHVNYGLRDTADRDENLVRSACSKHNIRLHSRRVTLPAGQNTEAAAREARYIFFKELTEEFGYAAVLTAHTASDVVETFLMRILSNKEMRSIETVDTRRSLVRPMLTLSRKEVEAYASSEGVVYFDDESNFDTSYLRNRVRHTLLPFLRDQFNENIDRLLLERAQAAATDIDCLERLVAEQLREELASDFGSREWLQELRRVLQAVPVSLAWRVVEQALYPKLRFNLGRRHSERVRAVLLGKATAAEIPAGYRVARKGGGIRLTQNI